MIYSSSLSQNKFQRLLIFVLFNFFFVESQEQKNIIKITSNKTINGVFNISFQLTQSYIIQYKFLFIDLNVLSQQVFIDPLLLVSESPLLNLTNLDFNQLINNSSYKIDQEGMASKSQAHFLSIDLIRYQQQIQMNLYFFSNYQTQLIQDVILSLNVYLSNQQQCIKNCQFTDSNMLQLANPCAEGKCICSSPYYFGRLCNIKYKIIHTNNLYLYKVQGWQWNSLAFNNLNPKNRYRFKIKFDNVIKFFIQIIFYQQSQYQDPNYLENIYEMQTQIQENEIVIDQKRMELYQEYCIQKQILFDCKIIISIMIQKSGYLDSQVIMYQDIIQEDDLEQFQIILIIVLTVFGFLIIIIMTFMFCRKLHYDYSAINQQNLQIQQHLQKKIDKCLSLDFINKYMPDIQFEKACNHLSLIDNNECVICLCNFDKLDFVRITICYHIFHKECIDMWFSKNTVCPTCRQDNSKSAWLQQKKEGNKQECSTYVMNIKSQKYIQSSKKSLPTVSESSINNKEIVIHDSSNKLIQYKCSHNQLINHVNKKNSSNTIQSNKTILINENFQSQKDCEQIQQQVSLILIDDNIEENKPQNSINQLQKLEIGNQQQSRIPSRQQQRSQRSIVFNSERCIQVNQIQSDSTITPLAFKKNKQHANPN